jgi:CRP-like cAMP-binding protein
MCEAKYMIDPKTLQNYSLFGGFLDEQIKPIIPLMYQETYKPNDYIIKEGSPNDKIYFILKGRVSVIKGDKVIYDLADGNTFGEMEVLDVMPSAANIKAQTDVTVALLSNKSLREIYRNDIKSFSLIMMNLARELSRRLRIANTIIADGKVYELYSSALLFL